MNRIDVLEEKYKIAIDQIKRAMSISPLWLIGDDIEVEHESEAIVLQEMYNGFKEIVENDDKLSSSSPSSYYVASFRNAQQVTQYEWDSFTETKIIDENTTIGELQKWYTKQTNGGTGLSIEISKST